MAPVRTSQILPLVRADIESLASLSITLPARGFGKRIPGVAVRTQEFEVSP